MGHATFAAPPQRNILCFFISRVPYVCVHSFRISILGIRVEESPGFILWWGESSQGGQTWRQKLFEALKVRRGVVEDDAECEIGIQKFARCSLPSPSVGKE